MQNPTRTDVIGPRMKGIRQLKRSASLERVTAEMAPATYGGIVNSWAWEEVYPMDLVMEGMVNLRPVERQHKSNVNEV